MAGKKRNFKDIKKPSDKLTAILEHMGFRSLVKEEEEAVKDFIFELGLRELVKRVKPGDSFE